MIENALHPGAAHCAIRAIGQNGGILDRDVDLIVEAIRDPAANLLRRRGTHIHQHIERMMNVVGPLLGSQLRLEFLPAPGSEAHRTISMPSHATSTPRRASSADSAGASSRMGVVLLMWIKILRTAAGRRSRHSGIPPAPLCARCPVSRARLDEIPSLTISSSVQTVPSTSTQAADCMARHTALSTALKPGAYTRS